MGEPEDAVVLARAILADSPETIDAYVLLAAATEVRAEAIALLKEAVCVGEAFQKGEASEDAAYDRDAHTRARAIWRDCSGRRRGRAIARRRCVMRGVRCGSIRTTAPARDCC